MVQEKSKCCKEEMLESGQCLNCGGSGFIEKTEWSGTDDSYEVLVRCTCNEY